MRRTRSWNSSQHHRPQRPAPAAVFVHTGGAPSAPRFLHSDFASALRAALPTDPTLGPIVAAASAAAGPVDADGTPCGPASPPRRSFVCRDGLLYLRSPHGDRLCIPEAGGLRLQVCRSFTPRPWAGTSGATRRSHWLAAQCGGPACPLRWRGTSGPALPANASRPPFASLPPLPPAGADTLGGLH